MNNLENICLGKQHYLTQYSLWMGGSIVLAAFHPILAVVPLKDALGLAIIDFWAFKKIIMQVYVKCDIMIWNDLKCPKNQIFPILMQLLMVPLSWAYQKLPKTIEAPSKGNIEWATAICLKKNLFPKKQIVAFPMYSLHTHTQPSAEHFVLGLNKKLEI